MAKHSPRDWLSTQLQTLELNPTNHSRTPIVRGPSADTQIMVTCVTTGCPRPAVRICPRRNSLCAYHLAQNYCETCADDASSVCVFHLARVEESQQPTYQDKV